MYASLLNFTIDRQVSGSLGAAVINVGPVVCISLPLTARGAT